MRNIITHITNLGELFIACAFTIFTGMLLGLVVAGLIMLISFLGVDTLTNLIK